MINSKMIYRITGFLLLIETGLLLCCAGVSLIYREDDLSRHPSAGSWQRSRKTT